MIRVSEQVVRGGLVTIMLPDAKPKHSAVGMLSIDLLPKVAALRKAQGGTRDAYLRLGAVLVQVKAQVLHGEYMHVLAEAGINRKSAAKAVRMLVMAFEVVDEDAVGGVGMAGGDARPTDARPTGFAPLGSPGPEVRGTQGARPTDARPTTNSALPARSLGDRFIDRDRMDWCMRAIPGKKGNAALQARVAQKGTAAPHPALVAAIDKRREIVDKIGLVDVHVKCNQPVTFDRNRMGSVGVKCNQLVTFDQNREGSVHAKCSTSGTFGKDRLGGGVVGGAEDGGRGRPPHQGHPPHQGRRDAAGQMRMDELYLAADRIRAFARDVQEGLVDAAVLGRVLGEIAGLRVGEGGGPGGPPHQDARPTGGSGDGGEKRT